MIRSGSTWQYNIAREILESRNMANPEGFIKKGDKLENLVPHQDNFIVKIHTALPIVINDIKNKTAKGIYIYRDLEDVAVSVMKMKQKPLQWVIDNEDLKLAWENYKIWTSIPGILIQEYSQVMRRPKEAIKEIANYLSVELTEQELADIQNKYSIESQKKIIEGMKGSKMLRTVRKRVGGAMHALIGKQRTKNLVRLFGGLGAGKIDKNRLLHSDHINTGEVGYWKKALKPAEQKILQEYISDIKKNLS